LSGSFKRKQVDSYSPKFAILQILVVSVEELTDNCILRVHC
jgi:hypothetical protein